MADLGLEEKQELTNALSYRVQDFIYMPRYKSGDWDGFRRFFIDNGMHCTFPTGLIHYVIDILSKHGHSVNITDNRKKYVSKNPINFTAEGLEIILRQYQLDTAIKSIEDTRGIIKVATGGGKSYIIMKIIQQLGLPALVYVNRSDIFRQLYEDLDKNLDISIGRIGNGILDFNHRVNVVMYQTMVRALGFKKKADKIASKYQESDKTALKRKIANTLVTKFPVFILDEAHHASCDSIWHLQKKSINAYYRFFTTATPWREDNADIMIEAASGKKIVDISASYLIREKYLAKPHIYMLEYIVPERVSQLSYGRQYKYGIVQNYERNILILKLAVKALWTDKRTLIAVKQVEHGKQIEKILLEVMPEYKDQIKFVYGGSESDERKEALRELNDGVYRVVVATSIFGEGVDVPNLEILINAKGQKSAVDSMQLAGRVLRLPDKEKDEVMIIDIADEDDSNFTEYTKAREDIYRTEEEFEIKWAYDVDEIKEPYWKT